MLPITLRFIKIVLSDTLSEQKCLTALCLTIHLPVPPVHSANQSLLYPPLFDFQWFEFPSCIIILLIDIALHIDITLHIDIILLEPLSPQFT